MKKVVQEIECAGHEANLNECRITVAKSQPCSVPRSVAGVICTSGKFNSCQHIQSGSQLHFESLTDTIHLFIDI